MTTIWKNAARLVGLAIFYFALGSAEPIRLRTTRGAQCKYEQTDKLYFYGPIMKNLTDIADHDQCVLECWKAQVGKKCRAVNFIQKEKKCQLLTQKFNNNDPSRMTFYGDYNPDSSYMVPTTCASQSDSPDPISPAVNANSSSPMAPGNTIPKNTCGQTVSDPMPSALHRIVGGKESKPHSLPWIVSLRQGFSQMRHFCGGTLLRVNDGDESDIVLTAAHCNEDGLEPDFVQIVIGAHDLMNDMPGEQKFEYEKFVSHKEYNETSMENDIAIIKLAKPVKFSNTIQPVCLPSRDDKLPDDTRGLVAGWGNTKEGKDQAEKLMQLVVPIVNYKKCFDFYKNSEPPKTIHDKLMICAGYPQGGKDSCQGDSGGPLTFKSPKGYTLHGVVSFGKGCARVERPGIYARVTTFIDWINKKIGELSDVAKNGKRIIY